MVVSMEKTKAQMAQSRLQVEIWVYLQAQKKDQLCCRGSVTRQMQRFLETALHWRTQGGQEHECRTALH